MPIRKRIYGYLPGNRNDHQNSPLAPVSRVKEDATSILSEANPLLSDGKQFPVRSDEDDNFILSSQFPVRSDEDDNFILSSPVSEDANSIPLAQNSPRSENEDIGKESVSSFEDWLERDSLDANSEVNSENGSVDLSWEEKQDIDRKCALVLSLFEKNNNKHVHNWPIEDVLKVAVCYGICKDTSLLTELSRAKLRFFAATCVLELEFGNHYMSPKSKEKLEAKHK
jgi:hypothetical protein